MYMNPFIINRHNHVTKNLLYKIFPKIDLEKYFYLEAKNDTFQRACIASLNNLLDINNSSEILELIRATKGKKTNRLKLFRSKLLKKDPDFNIKELNEYIDYLELLEQNINFLNEEYIISLNNTRKSYQQFFLTYKEHTKTLLQTNFTIYSNMTKYLDKDVKDLTKNDRKIEQTFYNFILRSMLKTSPFSFLTTISRNFEPHVLKICSSTTINLTLIYKIIFFYLYKSDTFLKKIKYSLPPISFEFQDGIYANFIVNVSSINSKKILYPNEGLKKIKITKTMYQFIKDKEIDEFFSMEDLLSIFKKFDQNSINKERLTVLIKKYVEIGFFVPVIGFDESSSDNLIDSSLKIVKNFLEENEYTDLHSTLSFLKNTGKDIKNCDSLDRFYLLLQQLQTFIKRINKQLGIDYSVHEVFYIDSYTEDKDFNANFVQEKINGLLDYENLELIQKFNLIFDTSIRLRLELKQRIHERFLNNKYIPFNHEFFSVLFSVSKDMVNYWTDFKFMGESIFKNKEIHYLDSLKHKFMKELNNIVAENEEEDCLDISILIQKYVDKLPQHIVTIPYNSTFFIQFNNNFNIINACYEGNERYSARFMNYYDNFLDNNQNYLNFIQNHYIKNNYYELSETYGFNGNMKRNRLYSQCYTVGLGNSRFYLLNEKKFDVLKIEDLYFVNDNSHQMLVRKDSEIYKEVKLCMRGSLTSSLMPNYVSTILQLFSSGAAYYKLPELINANKIPRLMIGNVIISRKRFRIHNISELYESQIEKNDFNSYIYINKVFKKYNLFSEFFVQIDRNHSFGEGVFGFKPMYYNISNPTSCKNFIKQLSKHIRNEEMPYIFLEEYLSNNKEFSEEYQIELYSGGD